MQYSVHVFYCFFTFLFVFVICRLCRFPILGATKVEVFFFRSLLFQMSDLGTWFRSVPIVTRYWFAISVILPLLGRFGLIHPVWMYLDWDLVVYRFHVSSFSKTSKFVPVDHHILSQLL